jgi:hypothetical protein
VVAISPQTTGMMASSALVRSWSIMGESSMPVTGKTELGQWDGHATVPIANSSARPFPASSASRSTVGFSTSGANMPVPTVS